MSWWSRWRSRRDEPGPPAPVAGPADPWRPLAGEFALRLLTLTWEAVHHIGQAEEAEPDPQRRALLFRIDHTITRTRRLAENLRVLTGEAVDDPDRQTITLHDVARAAGAAAEHYGRLRFGPIADLAVTADAADDVIRILTELIDNADRYSPPDQPVGVAMHLTGGGDVLVRVEDHGIGVPPDRLQELNHLLSGSPMHDAELQPSRVGIPVVAVLTRRHPELRAWLSHRSTGGTVAMLSVGAGLLCEAPSGRYVSGPIPYAVPSHAGPPGEPAPRQAIPRPRATSPAVEDGGPAGTGAAPMPRRVPGSVREARPEAGPATGAAGYRTAWHDDAEAFNAGVDAARRDRTPDRGGVPA